METVYDFESFIDKYKDKEKFSKKYELSTVNLWAEIRGVIKGGLNNNMARGNDSEQSGKVNPKMRMLSLEEYESLSDDNTIVPKEIRKKVYKLCVEYDKWLKENNKYDENDLIMEMLKMENESFDLVAIDEVQDYTELQIYYMCSLAKNKNNVVMDGDIHQIINPNVFNDRRIKTLFNNVQEYALNYNHRCTTEIIDCVNALSSLRVKKIGKRKGEEYGECKVSGRKPIDFKYTKDNIKRLIDKLLEYPGAMILVPDTETKKRLIAEYGQEKYKKKTYAEIVQTVNVEMNIDWLDNQKETDISKKELMIVNRIYGLSEDYVPEDLVDVPVKYAYAGKKLSNSVLQEVIKLIEEGKTNNYNFVVSDGYRSYEDQKKMYDSYADSIGISETDEFVARPGHSEHQSGLLLELKPYNKIISDVSTNEEYLWLRENAHKFGFIFRYNKEHEDLTGFSSFTWKIRYVGVEAATKIYNEGICFEEYYAYYVGE